MNLQRALLLLFALCEITMGHSLYAQSHLSNYPTVYVADKKIQGEIVGAVVTMTSKKDTIRGITRKTNDGHGYFGEFRHNGDFKDSVTVEINFLGYKPFSKKYSKDQASGKIYAFMEEDEKMLGEIVIVADQIAMVIKGDTTLYNAAAYKTLDQDQFSELIKQLPGVEVKNNKIFSNGVEIKRIYVDGKNLFGSNTSFSLTDLEAKDVKNVKVYDEADPSNHQQMTRKVMNVETHSQQNIIRGGIISLSAGASLQKEYSGKAELRHTEEANYYQNSESLNLRGSIRNTKNDDQKEVATLNKKITPSENTAISLLHDYRKQEILGIGTNVNIQRDKKEDQERRYTSYFPTVDYSQREIDTQMEKYRKSWDGTLSNHIDYNHEKHNFLSFAQLSYNRVQEERQNNSTQVINQNITSTYLDNRLLEQSILGMYNFIYSWMMSKKTTFSLIISEQYSRNKNDGWQADTLTSTPGLRILLNNNANGHNNLLNTTASLSYKITTNSQIELSYEYTHQNSKNKQIGVDLLNDPAGTIDPINTYDYTLHSQKNTISANWIFKKENHWLMATLNGGIYDIFLNERYPEEKRSPHHYYLFEPLLSYTYNNNKSSLRVNFSVNTNELSTEMLRNTLNTTNPLYVIAGNPSLRPSKDTRGSVSYNVTLPRNAATLEFQINGNYSFDFIASKQTLFLSDTYLPEYNYTIQKGAQLNSYENIKGSYRVGASTNYSQRIQLLKSTLRSSIAYSYIQTPYFLGGKLFHSNKHEGNMDIRINTGFSTHVTINMASNTSIGSYTSQNDKRNYLQQKVIANINYQFATHYFGNYSMIYEYYQNSSPSFTPQNNLSANTSLGRYFGKDQKFALSIGVIDLFNSSNYKNTLFQRDYSEISESSFMGRYAYLKISYQL